MKMTKYILINLISDQTMTKDKLLNNINEQINNNNIDINETYCVLISYSLWEIIDDLQKIHNIKKIKRNGHIFSPLHQALNPNWLWNYYNKIKEISQHLKRNLSDLIKMIKYLLDNNLIDTVLETTPIRTMQNDIEMKTSIALITQIIPKKIIEPIFDELYNILTINLSNERIIVEIDNVIKQIPNSISCMENNDSKIDYDKLSNELRWVMSLNSEMFVKKFIELYIDDSNITDSNINDKLDVLLKLTKGIPHKDGIYDIYFSKYIWNEQIVNSICDDILKIMTLEIKK
jgi:hypothetical protein